MNKLPPFLDELLAAPPRAGEGVHQWLFRVARQLHVHLPALEIIGLLESRVKNCGRTVSRQEIANAVKDALAYAWQPNGMALPVKFGGKWPKMNDEQRAAIIHDGGGLPDLWEASRVRLEDDESHTEEIMDRLFPSGVLLCCGKSSQEFDTRPREVWRGELSALPLVVPSPMSAVTGLTKGGTESKHSLDNTGPRRFLICEFDTGTTDEHAALLLHLGTIAPLVCAVHSGGKSLHGWFYVEKSAPDKVQRFFRYAVSLGADPMTWTKSQFVRMPDGLRDNGNRQAVYFLNFKSLGEKHNA
jgi:hypothetical protein